MRMKGVVIRGEGKGAIYGVPTANLDVHPSLASGIYSGQAAWKEQLLPCVISWNNKFEVHLLDWSGDLYGQELEVEVGERISDFVPFENDEQMKTKIFGDLRAARERFKLDPTKVG